MMKRSNPTMVLGIGNQLMGNGGMDQLRTYHIHFNGIVQGVGFRPIIHQIAIEKHLKGYVRNDNDGLNIVFNAEAATAGRFFQVLQQAAPERSAISSAIMRKVPNQHFTNFSIQVSETENTDSEPAQHKKVMLSPDIALCDNCRDELKQEGNKRYRYPFITCTQCGPRYSVISQLPYERHYTVMQDFKLCQHCSREYFDVQDRRFFSQTNSCNHCGMTLSLYEAGSGGKAPALFSKDTETVLSMLKHLLELGKILAVKGIGGYLLLCDANHPQVIQRLRQLKQRPTKPLAVLYPEMETIMNNFKVGTAEKKLLSSAAAPIVLLKPLKKVVSDISLADVAPGLQRIGVMLPSNPLFELIASDFGKPLIATSANLSGSPIIYQDNDALNNLFDFADAVVVHNRKIIVPEDDSVLQVTEHSQQKIVLRRSRGYAPSYMGYPSEAGNCILGIGAYLKSTFSFAQEGNVFVSQYLGCHESFESQLTFKDTLQHALKLYAATPEVIVADRHPGYFSRQYAHILATQLRIKVKLVQHHNAHFAAVLAEHRLLNTEKMVLGVVWDGTGFGDDGHIWGGEFFTYQNKEMIRRAHFSYFPSIAGDQMSLQPRIAALCAADGVELKSSFLKDKFTALEWHNYHSLLLRSKLFSSSVGRIFDAVACLLNINITQSYEAEVALQLQQLAEEYVTQHGFLMDESYLEDTLSVPAIMEGVMQDFKNGETRCFIAAKFHYSLVRTVGNMARKFGVKKICFSGGVFQNSLLVDWMIQEYSDQYQLYFHQELSPNDENISFGQLVYEQEGIKDNLRKLYHAEQ